MGMLNKVKNRYLVNRSFLWIVSMILMLVTDIECLCLFIQGSIRLSNMPSAERLPVYYICIIILEICFVVNGLAIFFNRRYRNTPILVAAVATMAFVVAILLYDVSYMLFVWLLPLVSVVVGITNIVSQLYYSKKKKNGNLVKIAKVKPDLDFQPEDMIEEYRESLKAIEEKYDMGNEDREAFEKEKEELMKDMNQILMDFVSNDNVSLIYKLETLYQAKTECIIPEDNYLLLKNQIINNKDSVEDVHYKNEELLRSGKISSSEYAHREELLKNEL